MTHQLLNDNPLILGYAYSCTRLMGNYKKGCSVSSVPSGLIVQFFLVSVGTDAPTNSKPRILDDITVSVSGINTTDEIAQAV